MMLKIWEKLIRPVMFSVDAERAHEVGIGILKLGFGGSGTPASHEAFGKIERFGLEFVNPLGIAAGFDKNGGVVNQLASLGFGFVEVGTVTYEPQSGNPKPRMFRLPDDKALINRLGFNNDGAVAVSQRLRTLDRKCLIGINIGKNKAVANEEATENYLRAFDLVHPVADYVVVNVSSPNTPNLRELQKADNLSDLLESLQRRNIELGARPLLVKIAPDVTESEIESIVGVAIQNKLDGIIATNTTISRQNLLTEDVSVIGAGGLSGRPLTQRSTEVISTIYRYAETKLQIIGVGGIFSAEDAFEKIAAGASLIQAYTGFIYGGPSYPRDICKGLSSLIKDRGLKTLDEAVGSAVSGQKN